MSGHRHPIIPPSIVPISSRSEPNFQMQATLGRAPPPPLTTASTLQCPHCRAVKRIESNGFYWCQNGHSWRPGDAPAQPQIDGTLRSARPNAVSLHTPRAWPSASSRDPFTGKVPRS